MDMTLIDAKLDLLEGLKKLLDKDRATTINCITNNFVMLPIPHNVDIFWNNLSGEEKINILTVFVKTLQDKYPEAQWLIDESIDFYGKHTSFEFRYYFLCNERFYDIVRRERHFLDSHVKLCGAESSKLKP
ncbi:hypothetical protein ACFE04_010020 [Oxalis oulophora]